MTGPTVKAMPVGSLSGVHHDEYTVENLDFVTRLPDHVRQTDPRRQSEYMLHEVINVLTAKLLSMDGVFTIDTRYNTDTKDTDVYHRFKVLVKRK